MNFNAGDQFIDLNTDEVFHIQEMEEIVVHAFNQPPFKIHSYFLQGTQGNEQELNHCELVDLINNDQLIEEL
tara:strand:+ start:449 stop:664 length:216 start_codon:yes stop_codon:yes gene_type:complete